MGWVVLVALGLVTSLVAALFIGACIRAGNSDD